MLNNLKILDLSRVLAGPLCTMTLGDLGADVIKVERPGLGDDTRGWGPPFDGRGQSAYYLSVNRNKKSIALDLDTAADQSVILKLMATADVVVENFKRGTLERRGFVPSYLLQRYSDLVWCTISGFGASSSRVGYDLVVQAESGWMSITGDPAGEPMRAGVALADTLAGKDAAISILAVLAARNSASRPLSAQQRHIEISLQRSATAGLINVAQNSLVSGDDATRWGNQHPNLVPYQLFQAEDRPLIIAVGTDAQWKACATALELNDLAPDDSLASNAGRLAHRERVISIVGERVRLRTARDWVVRLDAAGVPCGLVRTVLEALADVSATPETGIEPSVPGAVRLPPPLLDEHREAILSQGWNAFDQASH
ncbi:MAG: CoA transferase [Gemmatimonadaceae bacterium]